MKHTVVSGIICFLWVASLAALPYEVPQDIQVELIENEQLLEQRPTSNQAMFNMSMSYAFSGQIDKGWNLLKQIPQEYSETVINQYEALIKQDPNEWKYYFKLAFGYYFQKKEQLAIDQFKRVIELDSTNVWAYGFIALIYNEMGDPKLAIQFCKTALDIEPKATAIYALQAAAYQKKGNYIKAIRSFLKFNKLYKQHD